ncbi:MAG: putative type secretion system integral rane subunit [Solirubrobacterales bacterium]|nr:putative type secretion system integral rane subunit [Solirubrobacterales bacterium]
MVSLRGKWRVPAAVAMISIIGFLLAPASRAAPTLRASEGGGATFPSRSLVLSVANRGPLRPSQVHIAEDNQPVASAVVRPIARAGVGDFGVVLAIDVGPSMKGAPLARAMAAARALAAQRTGNQALAVVAFDESATVTLPLTDNPQAIARALSQAPPIGHGAYIYSALTVAVRQLANARIAAGAVILLSDGASEGAKPSPGHNVTATSIGAAAAAAHAQIYTVGLRDSSYTPQRMSLLARVGGGAFIESSSSQLAGVFTQIEAGLTSAYVVHYRSLAPLGHRVTVSVTVDGIQRAATVVYDSPPAPLPTSKAKRPKPESFWVSTLALVAFSCGAALLLGLAMFIFLLPRLRRGGLRQRVGAFTAREVAQAPDAAGTVTSRPLLALERLFERTRWWPQFKANVEIAGIDRAPIDLVAVCALNTVAAAVLFGVALGTPVVSILALFLGPLALASMVKRRLRKQRDLFAEQLPTHLQELASTMRAGHSLVSGITSMARTAPEPARSEWARVVADEQLGMPLEEAMRPLARRMDSEDIEQVALVASLHHRTGGNMAEVLERVADSVRERAELHRELRALTAQARLSRYVVTALPLLVAGAIALINPGYLSPLFNTSAGVVLVFIVFGLLVSASLVMRAITNIKV